MEIDPAIIEELKEAYDKNAEQGAITRENLGQVFKDAGEAIPNFQIRDICDKHKKGEGSVISQAEFLEMCKSFDLKKMKASQYKSNVQTKTGVTVHSGYEQTVAGTKHSVSDAERVSFTNYVNQVLMNDPDVKGRLPLNPDGDDLYKAMADGIILCKLVNIAEPRTIDERAINKTKLTNFTAIENLNLAINSCISLGCHVVNVGPTDIRDGRVHLILGLLWQVIKMSIFQGINIKATPDLLCMLREGETLEYLLSLSPEELLLRWVNYQIEPMGYTKQVTNFGSDLKDSTVYAALEAAIMSDKMIHQRHVIEREPDETRRAQLVLENSKNAGIIALTSPYDIVNANAKLNMVYLADMFNKYPNLKKVDQPVIEETREEKCYRNWMNSLGVRPFVQYLFNDLSDGTVLLQTLDILTPKCVKWEKVNRPPFKENRAFLEKCGNCNQVVDLAKTQGFSTVSLGGDNIANASGNHILALVWQLMSRYTLQMLQQLSGSDKPINDAAIIAWANKKYEQAGQGMKISSFKDPNIINSKAIFGLVSILKPDSFDKALVVDANTDEDRLKNAQLAISLCRKIGAKVYALPEDIIEGNKKMIMTVFACLMIVDYTK